MRPGGLALTARAVEGCALRPRARVLDVGCGQGHTLAWLRGGERGLRAAGLDRDRATLAGARLAGAGPLVRADARALPVRAGALELVMLECCLSVIGGVRTVLAECARALAPGGRLLVTDVVRRVAAGPGEPELALLDPLELCHLVEDAGFVVEHVEDHAYALADLVARHLLSGRSIEELWSCRCRSPADAMGLGAALRAARPGYVLLVARALGAPGGDA